jgi:hypothetical protein
MIVDGVIVSDEDLGVLGISPIRRIQSRSLSGFTLASDNDEVDKTVLVMDECDDDDDDDDDEQLLGLHGGAPLIVRHVRIPSPPPELHR